MNITNTIIYVSLCNVSVIDAYIGGFRWIVLGSSITNPVVTNYPLIPTYAPTTLMILITESNVSKSDLIIGGLVFEISIFIVALLGGVVWYRQWSDKHNNIQDEHQSILSQH
jgi:hypothetical protein